MANFVIKQGEAKTLTLTVTDQNGEAVDLTGATLALEVKAIQVQAFCLKGAFIDTDRLKLGVRIDNTDYLSDPIDLPVSSLLRKHILNQNPAGGNWTVDAVNNARLALQAVN